MSWMKRAQGGAAPPPGSERQAYAAPQAQPFGNQQNMYSNFQGGTTGSAPPQQFWQMPPQQQQQPQYNQQFGQVYQQQDYPANANQFYQPNPNQFNQTYTNQGNTQQQSYQQNYYQNQGAQQQNFQQNKANADSWEDNWDWGWEESAKQAQKASQHAAQQPNAPQQQVFNNANVIAESFASTDSWNWSMDDKKEPKETPTVPHMNENKEPTLAEPKPAVENNAVPGNNMPVSTSSTLAQPAEEVRTLNDREVVKERLPNLALGKRFHLDNLTPQWSIESQMSQESSDGPHTQSEGTYRSENQSRNSSKSSPGLNTDNSNFNYSQAALDEGYSQNSEWSRPSDEPTLADSIQTNSLQEIHEELSGPMQDMSLNNHENPSKDKLHPMNEVVPRTSQEHLPTQPPAFSPPNFLAPVPSSVHPPPLSTSMPPPPPVSSVPLPVTSSTALSAPPSSSAIPPPNIPPSATNQNPFKMNAGPFSHKTIAKVSTSAPTVQAFPPPMPSTNLTSPAVVSKVSQNNRVPLGFEANLETTPDNSERPDQLQVSAFRPMAVSQQVPDNMEVAPRNDRNEYLQTAHLSSSDYGENTDFSTSAPPPGLRRMVVGQQESEYNQNLNISGDEPPPGLARMVPGQQTEAENAYNQSADNYLDRHIDGQPTDSGARPYRQADGQQTPDNYTQPAPARGAERRPIGLDRMVPGEPSNDDYSQYQGSNYAANEHRVVTGLDHDFSMPSDSGPPDVREQNVDGSDYTEQSARNPQRNIIGARESSNDASPDFNAPPDEQQREVTMEGENLQDLSIISSTELTYSREQVLDGADITLTDIPADRKTDLSDSIDHPTTSSRRQSLNRVNSSGEDSERDRAFKSSPRRDKHKSTRDRDQKRDRDRDRERDRERDKEGRYSRGDRKYEADRRSVRDERRDRDGYARDRRDRDRDDRRDRDDSPDTRRARRAARAHRYETEDTDYYSDRERDRRRHREGSYTSSKPPRPDDKERRYGDERDRSKRYHTIERDRRYDEERSRRSGRRSERHRERYERGERAYRDIDPARLYGLRAKDDPRRGQYHTIQRDRRYDEERSRRSGRRSERHRERYERGERAYRDIDPARLYGLRAKDDPRRGQYHTIQRDRRYDEERSRRSGRRSERHRERYERGERAYRDIDPARLYGLRAKDDPRRGQYHTIQRDRRYDEERSRRSGRRSERHRERYERGERAYRDIDPARLYGLRAKDDPRRGQYHTIQRDRRYDEERSRRSGRRSERHRERYERGERAYRDIDPARLYGLRAKDDPRRGQYHTIQRDRRYDEERSRRSGRRSERHRERYERGERAYRDIDPARLYGLRAKDDPRRGQYHTIQRDRRYDEERSRRSGRRSERHRERYERGERAYRDIDPARLYGLRAKDDPRRGQYHTIQRDRRYDEERSRRSGRRSERHRERYERGERAYRDIDPARLYGLRAKDDPRRGQYHTIQRDRRYDEERSRRSGRRSERHRERYERGERAYRDIDPARLYGLRAKDDPRRGQYHTIQRDRRYDEERSRRSGRRSERHRERYERGERAYRDIDPARLYGLRAKDDPRRGQYHTIQRDRRYDEERSRRSGRRSERHRERYERGERAYRDIDPARLYGLRAKDDPRRGQYHTIQRDRRYDEERSRRSGRRSERHRERYERGERAYRDIDPARLYGLRAKDDPRRGQYHTIQRDRRYDEERSRRSGRRSERHRERYERGERAYRDIDPARLYGLRAKDDPRRGQYHTIQRDRRYDEERSRRSGRRSERHRERYERGERAYRDIDPARLYGLRAKDDPRRGQYHTIQRDRRYDEERSRRSGRRSERHRERYERGERAYRDIDPARLYGLRAKDDPRRGQYHTIQRDRRYDEERSRRSGRRSERHRERYERGERAYRDIDPARLYGLRAKDDPRRGEFSSPSRPDSREAAVTDDDAADARRRGERRARRTAEPFYDEYGAYADPYLAQRQQYAYYEQLRLRDPAAYMLVYKQLLAGRAPPAPPAPYDAFGAELAGAAYEARRDERASLHSGRSSAGLKGNDTDLNTDMSLNLHLEESTVRSERMTPFRYSTAHIKGSVASRDVVVVRAAYPVDGAPATVHVLSLAAALAHLPAAQDFAAFPGPLLKGVTHKKSVIDYCEMRVRNAEKEGARDVTGYVLMWDLLALMLRQNGVVVGTDIAELLMKNVREYEYKVPAAKSRNESRRGSSVSGEGRDGREEELRSSSPDQPSLSMSENLNQESSSSPGQAAAEERAALDRLRDLLLCGNRQDAIEWAVSTRLWGHALQLSAHAPRRVRASVAARFLPRCPRADPLTRCTPRWRARRRRRPRPTAPARRMLLANPTRPSRTGARCWRWATRWRRARPTARSCCYVAAGLPLARHPLAPAVGRRRAPRRAWAAAGRPARRHASTCSRTNKAALRHGGVRVRALAQTRKTLVITELQPYKFVLAAGCLDVGQYERRAGLHGGVRRAPSPARPPPSRPRCLPAGRAGRQAEVPRPGVGRGGRAGGGGQRGGVARHSTGSATSRAPPAKPTSCPYWSLYRAPAVPGWRAGGRGAAEYAPYYPAPAPEDSQPEEWASSRRAVREYEPEPYPYAEFVVFTINFNNSSRSDICFQSQYNISRVSRAIVFVSRPSYPLYAQMRIAGRATVRAVLYELCGAAVQPAPRRARPAPPAARPPAHRAPRPATARVAPHPAPRTSPSCAPPPRPALRRACCSRPALGAEPGRAGPAGPGGRVVAATVERWRGGERAARGYKPLPAPRRAPRPPRPQPAPPAHRAPRRPRARGAPPRAAGRARARALPRPRCAAACCSRPALAPSRGRAGPAGPGGRVVAATVERWRGGERAARGYKRWCSAARTHRRAGGPGRALARPADLRATIERSLDRFEAMLARRPARTFAIDAPTAPGARAPRPRATGTPILADLRATIERSLDRFEAMLARRPARTFAIDAPTAPGAPGPAAPRDWDAKYYVAGPKTYDIDEPVDYM
uniref:Sec16 Sec23-binding domain-containing protein n=1 Tax=Heliothis virescens TaxID=7102 RepID=A0A2A4JUU6_HELVI